MHPQTQTPSHNQPLPFTRDAIIGHFQHHATNGPAYVQIQATNALARIMGLFDEAKQAASDAAHHFSDESRALYKRAGQLMRGEVEPRPDDLHGGALPEPLPDPHQEEQEEDEPTHAKDDDDEPP